MADFNIRISTVEAELAAEQERYQVKRRIAIKNADSLGIETMPIDVAANTKPEYPKRRKF